jgi:two-component system, OmpR family, sensor histidine kinase KdpD
VSISARIERVRDEDLLDEPVPTRRAPQGVGRRRQLAGLLVAAVTLPLLTVALKGLGDGLSLEGQVLLYLLAVVIVALVGGIAVALLGAIAAALLINYWFVEPQRTLDVAHADQLVALVVFVAVAGIVSGAVELATRRARAAEQASAQAETLSALARADHAEQESLHAVLEQAREVFKMESVTLKVRERGSGEWVDADTAGWAPRGGEAALRFDVPITPTMRLVGRGPALFAEDQRVLAAFAGAAQTAYEGRRLGEQAKQAESLASVDRQRTALLAAVGHDLRTPLAGIKAAVSSLRQTDVEWSPGEREELLATIEGSADRLDAVVGNLLDASRLEAGAMSVQPEPVALDEVVSAAILAVADAADQVRVEVPDDLPLIRVDRGLLERVLVNLLDNALRHGASDEPVEVRAFAGGESAKLEIADHGRGVSREQRERLFEPFGRLDDRSTAGVGLGLTVARGFLEAMDGALVADATPGGGLTMRLRIPLAT